MATEPDELVQSSEDAIPERTHYDDALQEVSRHEPDYNLALQFLRSAVDARDPRGTYALATWYLHGSHVPRNLREALRLLRLAAKSKVPSALYDLAVCYETGSGVKENPRMAVQLYVEAALVGDPQSVYEVGRCYYHGTGVQRDRRIARVWLDRARALGIAD